MEKTVKMKLRVAIGSDFKTYDDKPFYGKMYFLFSKERNEFDDKPYYFTENTDKEDFRKLYQANQVYVPKSMFEPVELVED